MKKQILILLSMIPVSLYANYPKTLTANSDDPARKYILYKNGDLFRVFRGNNLKCKIASNVKNTRVEYQKRNRSFIYYAKEDIPYIKVYALKNNNYSSTSKDIVHKNCPLHNHYLIDAIYIDKNNSYYNSNKFLDDIVKNYSKNISIRTGFIEYNLKNNGDLSAILYFENSKKLTCKLASNVDLIRWPGKSSKYSLIFLKDTKQKMALIRINGRNIYNYIKSCGKELVVKISDSDPATKYFKRIYKKYYDDVINRMKNIYNPIFKNKLDKELKVNSYWENYSSTLHMVATADQSFFFRKPIINIYGIPYLTLTADALALIICHEIGHHIGGLPKISSFSSFSSEGQSDYFATLKCFRRYASLDDNQELIKNIDIPDTMEKKCQRAFSESEDIAICIRSIMTSISFVNYMFGHANINTPSVIAVKKTYTLHPKAQCRLDTYIAGALCPVDIDIDLSDENSNMGTCYRDNHDFDIGFRPLCWYGPESL